MPLYEYRCPNGHQFELIQRMDDAQPEACEVCAAGPLVKVLHPVPVFFKGSGFYSTDYGRKGAKRKGEASSDGDSSSKPDESVKKVDEKKKAEA